MVRREHRVTSAYAREAADFYVEQARSVRAVCAAENQVRPFAGRVWDPCCGTGTIPRVLAEIYGSELNIEASDLHQRGYGASGLDFFHLDRRVDVIISNPPFGLSMEFVLHALELATDRVIIINRLSWLEGQGRYAALFASHPPSRVYASPWRQSMPPGNKPDIKAAGGKHAYAWYAWDIGAASTGRPGFQGFWLE